MLKLNRVWNVVEDMMLLLVLVVVNVLLLFIVIVVFSWKEFFFWILVSVMFKVFSICWIENEKIVLGKFEVEVLNLDVVIVIKLVGLVLFVLLLILLI